MRRLYPARLTGSLAVVVLVAAACGSSATPSITGTPSSPLSSSGSGASLASPVAPTLSGKVNFPSHLWAQNDWLSRLAATFTAKNPNVTIAKVEVPFGTYHDKAFASMVSGNAPDIVVPYDPQIVQWVVLGLLEPLNPWLEQDGWTVDRLEKELLPNEQLAIRDGQVYGILQQSNPRTLIYNAAMLKAANVSVPKSATELAAAYKALTDKTKQQFGLVMSAGVDASSDTWIQVAPIIAGFGGALFNKDGQPTANDPKVVAALQFIKDAYDEGLFSRQDIGTQEQLFTQGKIAFDAVGSYMIGNVKSQNPPLLSSMSAETLPLPGNSTIAVDVFFAVPKAAKNKDAAAQFIISMLSDQAQIDLTNTYLALGARPDVGVTPQFLAQYPWFQAVLDAGKVAVPYVPNAPGTLISQVLDTFTADYQAMLLQGKSAQATADQLQTDLEALVGPFSTSAP